VWGALPPPGEWRRASYDPREGIYVRAPAARALGFETPRPAPAAAPWPPPPPPGWVYVGGVDPASTPQGTRDLLQAADSVEELLERVAGLTDTHVVTTRGRALPAGALLPRSIWRERPDWGEGVYVRAEFAQRAGWPEAAAAAPLPPLPREEGAQAGGGGGRGGMRGRRRAVGWSRAAARSPRSASRAPTLASAPCPPPVRAIKNLYVRLSALALDPRDMDVVGGICGHGCACKAAGAWPPAPGGLPAPELSQLPTPCNPPGLQVWLDDLHLSLVRDPRRPAPPGTRRLGAPPLAVLELRNVCWLDVAGTIPGVLPGTYQLAFCMDLSRHHLFPGDQLKLQARVEAPARGTGGGASGGTSGGGGSGSSGGGARREPGPEAEVSYGARELKMAQVEAARAGRSWTWLRGGVVRVEGAPGEGAPVRVACHSRSDTWKYGMRWAFAQLLPVPRGAVQAVLPRLVERVTPVGGGAAGGGADTPEPMDEDGSEWETDEGEGAGAAARGGWCSQQ
jgi:hypothetical protein